MSRIYVAQKDWFYGIIMYSIMTIDRNVMSMFIVLSLYGIFSSEYLFLLNGQNRYTPPAVSISSAMCSNAIEKHVVAIARCVSDSSPIPMDSMAIVIIIDIAIDIIVAPIIECVHGVLLPPLCP